MHDVANGFRVAEGIADQGGSPSNIRLQPSGIMGRRGLKRRRSVAINAEPFRIAARVADLFKRRMQD